jgi:geranylgeranyl reductase family protein
MHDVVIVGAGPSGASAAIALRQRGIEDVLLLDRDDFPRDKTCGSGLSPNALSLAIELGIDREVSAQSYPIDRVRIVTPGGREMVLASDAAAVVLLRKEFDNLLVQRARTLGATFESGFVGRSLIREGGRVVGVRGLGETPDGPPKEHRGRVVLCADGAHSIFSTDDRPKRSIATLMGWWEGLEHEHGQLDMIFDKNVAPLYGWMFPETDTRVNIGICLDTDDAGKPVRPLRETFEGFLRDQYGGRIEKAERVGRLKGHPIVYTTWFGHSTEPGALRIGEAARVTHNATGEGISQAMQSGIYAADAVTAVLREGVREQRAWQRYEWQHRKRFTAGFMGGLALRGIVDSPVLDGVARLYNSPRVKRTVVRLLGSALAGSKVVDAPRA